MNGENMQQATIPQATQKTLCHDSLRRYGPKGRSIVDEQNGDCSHRHECLDFRPQFAKRRGTSTLAIEKAMREDVIASCDEIDAEIFRVFTEKFFWEEHRAADALSTIQARGVRVEIRGTVKVCRDPSDNMFLECAALAKAELLVAGDNDLLTLGSFRATRIVTPSEYLRAE